MLGRAGKCRLVDMLQVVLVACCSLVANSVRADAGSLQFDLPTEPLSCLMSVRPERKLPEYPQGVVEGTNAVVRVKLQFKSADAAPVAVVTFNNGGPAFASTVTDHVSNYRLPCLPSGGDFIGVQEFHTTHMSAARKSSVTASCSWCCASRWTGM